jgi:hypothetical protein
MLHYGCCFCRRNQEYPKSSLCFMASAIRDFYIFFIWNWELCSGCLMLRSFCFILVWGRCSNISTVERNWWMCIFGTEWRNTIHLFFFYLLILLYDFLLSKFFIFFDWHKYTKYAKKLTQSVRLHRKDFIWPDLNIDLH